MSDTVLTIRDVARLLKLTTKTVYAMANAGELPAFRVRGQWRILAADFERWLLERAREQVRAPYESEATAAALAQGERK